MNAIKEQVKTKNEMNYLMNCKPDDEVFSELNVNEELQVQYLQGMLKSLCTDIDTEIKTEFNEALKGLNTLK